MSPRKGLAPLVVDVKGSPDDPPSITHSPLLAPGIVMKSFQQRGAPDNTPDNTPDNSPQTAVPDNSLGRRKAINRSQHTKGRSRCLVDVLREHLLLAVGGGLILGGVLILVVLHGADSGCAGCPPKWMRSDDSCFFISQKTKDWKSGLEFCRSDGGTLLTPDNETHQEMMVLLDLSGDYWVGLTKDTDSGKWRQLDGSLWTGPIEHDDPQRRCCVVDSGKYVALDCSTTRRWICVKTL